MLAAISRALEERDQTQGHGARVAALAEPVAQRLGWEAERIASLRFGAPLHDIGKVAVRRDVLRKAGPLELAELAEIRTHPRAGAELVLPIRAARPALPYVLFHHERWDGAGYPTGIRGRAIPVEARILAVADAFDAMTSQRPYRPALTPARALAEVRSCAGSQFDPELAELFLEVWSEQAGLWPAAVAS
jgi:HD-GYP domain-containing protein (c-di-GMP phosphodiesterase class II)